MIAAFRAWLGVWRRPLIERPLSSRLIAIHIAHTTPIRRP